MSTKKVHGRRQAHAAATSTDPQTYETPPSSTAAARLSSPGRTTRSTSGIWSSTTSSSLTRRRRARALRGRRPLRARCPLAALGAHRGDLRAREPQARLLPLDGVPHRPLAGQQRHEPAARSRSRSKPVKQKNLDWLDLLEQEPDAGLGNGGLGRLAACFLDSMATMQLPAMGYGLRYEYGIFRQTIQDGWQHEQPDNWLRRPDPWEVAAPAREGRGQAELLVRGARRDACAPIPGQPSSLIGIPFDRPVVGYGGKTINTLRLWAAAAPDYFDFQEFSSGDFVGALAETLAAESLTRVLYPDDSTSRGRGCASCRSISWSPARWPTSCGASAAATPTGARCPRRSPSSSTTRTRRWPSPS